MGNDLISSLSFAASGMETQAMRLRHVSENIANADTPGYIARDMDFTAALREATGSGTPALQALRASLSALPGPGAAHNATA